jgi:hypothetical protein
VLTLVILMRHTCNHSTIKTVECENKVVNILIFFHMFRSIYPSSEGASQRKQESLLQLSWYILWHAVWKAELKYPLPGNGYNWPGNRNSGGYCCSLETVCKHACIMATDRPTIDNNGSPRLHKELSIDYQSSRRWSLAMGVCRGSLD